MCLAVDIKASIHLDSASLSIIFNFTSLSVFKPCNNFSSFSLSEILSKLFRSFFCWLSLTTWLPVSLVTACLPAQQFTQDLSKTLFAPNFPYLQGARPLVRDDLHFPVFPPAPIVEVLIYHMLSSGISNSFQPQFGPPLTCQPNLPI